MDYQKFLYNKQHSLIDCGIEPVYIPDNMFSFQKHITGIAIKKGRCAGFLDTGLGKTLIELTIAKNYVMATNKPVLIITPLAVAFQFIREAEKFGIDDIVYSKDGKFTTKIVLCNYERLHYFNAGDFDCVILDESGILKNFEGGTKQKITSFLRKVKYRYLFTATPSPNDYIELGTSSEALGYLGYMDMLSRFFKNNQSTSKMTRAALANMASEWYLKPHAEKDFWSWVSSWSLSMRKPSDMGFDDTSHILPELSEITHTVRNESEISIDGQLQLFNVQAQNFFDIKREVKGTIPQRCEKAAEMGSNHNTSVYWVNLNEEAKYLASLDKDFIEIAGSMSIEEKEDILLNFSTGSIKKLITKPTITSFGLNWQHCSHTVFFPTYSYEQYYQAIRRFWRFGQSNPVTVDIIISDGQTKIINALMVKKEKAITMFNNLINSVNSSVDVSSKDFDKPITLPNFIRGYP